MGPRVNNMRIPNARSDVDRMPVILPPPRRLGLGNSKASAGGSNEAMILEDRGSS
jgi:hypothetical protein